MKTITKLIVMFFGLFLYALGIVLTIHSNLGASPWDVFHLGVINYTNITLGEVSQLTGLALIIISIYLGVRPGWGTILNMYFIGLFIDILREYNLVPIAEDGIQQIIMLLTGIYLIGWATYFYLSVGLGSGPRDSVMIGLIKKAKMPVWKIRLFIEGFVLFIGYLMGGLVGIGTVLIAVLLGFAIQHAFSVMKKNTEATQHRTLKDDFQFIKNRLKRGKKKELHF